MNELISAQTNKRLQLLGSVSAFSLLLVISTGAGAEDKHRPTVWIDIGGELSRLENSQQFYSPPFLAREPAQFDTPYTAMRPTDYGMELTGAISFEPENSNWIFAASVRYGRSSNHNVFHQRSYPGVTKVPRPGAGYKYQSPFGAQAISADSRNSESHAVLDFQAGRDIGIGLFGRNSSSTLNFGVRFAQFQSQSRVTLDEDPDWHFVITTFARIGTKVLRIPHQAYHTYEGHFSAERSFQGIGPSLSWKSAMPVMGDGQDSELTLDVGLNAAVLFGRQKAHIQHRTAAQYHAPGHGIAENPGRVPFYNHPTDAPAYYSTRDRNATVPNVGGFAGMSFRYDNAKVSFGYRADFFFGAIDGGIDSRKTYDRNFYGPYASVSIGLGD